MASKQKIIIDCDPGIDDALAIAMALASPQLEILGLTIVAGNRSLAKNTSNALKILEYFKREEIPVYEGASKPLARDLYDEPNQKSPHGSNGLGDIDFPEPIIAAKSGAAEFIKETITKYPHEVRILAIGPLTNIAVMAEEADLGLIKDLYFMNGAFWVPGNVSPHAEFNAFVDPEAAKIAYNVKVPTRAVGLDVTSPVGITREEFDELKKVETPQAQFFTRTHQYALDLEPRESYSLFYDSITLMWMLDNDLITGKTGKVEVDTEGEFAGRTRFIEGAGNTEVGASVDSKRFLDHLYTFLKQGTVV